MGLQRQLVVALFASLFLLALPREAAAQGLTGTIVGTVRDAQGGALPGAIVRISSPALMTGVEQTTSSDRGQWRFSVLPPGEYVLTIELAPTFTTYRQSGVTVGAGETLERPIVLQLAGVAESVDVAAADLGLTRTSGIQTRFGPEYIRNNPSRRYSMFSLINSAPGVSPTSPASGSINTVSVFGSAVNENLFLIDGTNFTCPCQGVSRAEPIMDVIQELHVQSMGASVEYGNFQGGVINVVTKQGGARLMGEASYYGQPSSLTAQPIVLAVTKGTQPTSGYERVRYRDLTTSLGGPIVRDRIWFFGSYQYLRDYDSQPGTDPAFPRTYEQNKFFGKLNWQLTPSLRLMQSFHLEQWVNPTPPTLSAPFVTTQRVHASVPNMTFANVTQVLSSRTAWEAHVGRFMVQQDTDPSSGDFTTPFHRDLVTGVLSGNAPQVVSLRLDRVTGKAVLHRYEPGWLGADHEFRIGTQIERGLHQKDQFFPGGVQFNDSNSAPFQAVFRSPSVTGGVFVTTAAFASDSFSIKNRVRLDAGVRFDHNRADNPDLPVIDAEGRDTGGVLKGAGTIYSWNVLSPRLGLNVNLDRSGTTVLRASYGRFNQGVLTGELDPISQGATAITTMEYEAATGGYTKLVSVVDPRINQAIDHNMRTPHTDEFSLALDREISPRLRASAAYIGKRGRDFIGWTDIGGLYRPETRTLANGVVLPISVLTNGTSARRFLLTNPDVFVVDYNALVVAVDKRLSNSWQASGSYTYSRATGLQMTSNGAANEPQFSTIASPDFLTYGQDPNDLTNAWGRLPNDRPHVFRANGRVHLPWQGILVAANLQFFSGKPWAATTQVSLPQGSRRILLESRGSRRLSSQTLLDARVAKTFRLRSTGSVEVMLDVLNLLDDTAEEALVSDNFFSTGTFGRPNRYIDPRRVMLGIRLNLGR